MNLSATLKFKLLYIIALACLLSPMAAIAAPVSHYKVVARYPHATSSYTEGLFYLDGIF